MNERIVVIGLGYVGLPIALAFAKKFDHVVGFDIDTVRVAELQRGMDRTGEVDPEDLKNTTLTFSSWHEALRGGTFFVVTVPTPIDANRQPDLGPLRSASDMVGRYLQPGGVVVYESTVYPGVTEEICGPILAVSSGLRQGVDFHLGYSPERINPGDRVHTLERIVKVVGADDEPTLDRVADVYAGIIEAGVHRASSIRVAEAAKVIENTQRDINIALMNELAIIFDRMGIRSADVLAAAQTKWNFLEFTPGLVDGHCIGVDPYYLTSKAQALGYHPEVILAGRRINDSMGAWIVQRLVKTLVTNGFRTQGARVGVLGITFKEDVPDLRNTRVSDIVRELQAFGLVPIVHDPHAHADEASREYGIDLAPWESMTELDAIIVAVSHREYRELALDELLGGLHENGIVFDVKSMFDPEDMPEGVTYWSL